MNKTRFLLFFFCFSSHFLLAQNSQLQGNLTINMSEGRIEGTYQLHGFKLWNGGITFLLNDVFKIQNVRLNGKTVPFDATDEDCYDCRIYTIKAQQVLASDILSFDLKGIFNLTNNENKPTRRDYKGLIAFNYGILRASEQAKWYPILIDSSNVGQVISFTKRQYNYEFEIDCPDCKSVYIGEGEPQNDSPSIFKSRQALDNIMLIAGDYEWAKEEKLILLNIPPKERKTLAKATKNIITYYETLTDKVIDQPFTVANCPSNVQWAFLTYPTIVFTRKSFKTQYALNTLSHEIAHYYFGNLYEPKSNLFWFYLESFAEYFSIKYQIKTGNTTALKNDYNNLKRLAKIQWIPFFKRWKGNDVKFVQFKKVKQVSQVHVTQRYLISPYQLLGIEHEIGEAKMLEWIPLVFARLEDGKDGYAPMVEAFEAIGISKEKIKTIEKKYFKKLKGDAYDFLEDY